MGQSEFVATQDNEYLSQYRHLLYLIFSPTLFSMALPEPQTHFCQLDALNERTLEIPDNVLEVAAVGFIAGLAGQLLFSPTTTTTTTTAAPTTTTTVATGK